MDHSEKDGSKGKSTKWASDIMYCIKKRLEISEIVKSEQKDAAVRPEDHMQLAINSCH